MLIVTESFMPSEKIITLAALFVTPLTMAGY